MHRGEKDLLMGTVAARMKAKLESRFSPELLEIVDDSDRHKGHSGSSEAGETHFSVTITSSAFLGVNRVGRQRLVMNALSEELAGPVHALSIKTLAPNEE
jgi:BolA protein